MHSKTYTFINNGLNGKEFVTIGHYLNVLVKVLGMHIISFIYFKIFMA